MIKRPNSYNKYLLSIICIIFLFQVISYYNFDKDKLYGDSLNSKHKVPSTSIFLEWNILIGNLGESNGRSIAIDSQNNIYIVGEIFNFSKSVYDILILKYNTSGDIEWNQTWGGDSDDKANAIEIDSSNNIYIVGSTNSYGNGSTDVCLIKYDNSGNLDWNKTWGKELGDFGLDLTLNGENIFIVGYTESFDVYGDILLLKYNSSGNLKLNTTWGGSDTDCGNAIEIDSNENIYITGYTSSFGAETSDLILIKCDKKGDHLWNITWGGNLPDSGNDLIIDLSKNITICGNTQNYGASNTDVVLLNVNNSGVLQWNFTYGTSNHDIGNSIDLDSKGNMFIAGYSNNDVLLLKINQTGTQKWMKTWGDNGIGVSNSIAIDNFDNIFLTGKKENEFNEFNIFLWKLLPVPDNFRISSNAGKPDPDGNFTLSWSESLDADNYSLYKSNYIITEMNGSVLELVKGNTNCTYSVTNLNEGTYYFKAVAFNTYGNTSSNCISIKVQFPPAEFFLKNHTEIYDTDGIVNLTWTISTGADNYSIFRSEDPIEDILVDGTLIADNISNRYYIENLTNGDYYYVVNAYNEAGETLSNCINVSVRRAPDSFSLTSDAGIPDDDGSFELIWSNSEYAQYYIIHFINHTGLNTTQKSFLYNFTPSFEWSAYRYQITGWHNGTYEFQITAWNKYGTFQTDWLEVKVSIPDDNSNQSNNSNFPVEIIQQIIIYLVFFGLLGVLTVLYIKFKR